MDKTTIAKIGIPLLAAGAASATTIDMEAALAPLVDLLEALPALMQALIPIVLVVVVIGAIVAIGRLVSDLLHKVTGSITLSGRK
jgi:hypothetical protein